MLVVVRGMYRCVGCIGAWDVSVRGDGLVVEQREAIATLGVLQQRPDLMPLALELTAAALSAVAQAGAAAASQAPA